MALGEILYEMLLLSVNMIGGLVCAARVTDKPGFGEAGLHGFRIKSGMTKFNASAAPQPSLTAGSKPLSIGGNHVYNPLEVLAAGLVAVDLYPCRTSDP